MRKIVFGILLSLSLVVLAFGAVVNVDPIHIGSDDPIINVDPIHIGLAEIK